MAAEAMRARHAEIGLGVDARHRLVLRLSPNPRVRRAGAIEEVLLSGVEGIALAYWRPARRVAAGGWVSVWNEAGLPSLVRLRIVFPAGDGRHWPDIVAAPLREVALK